MIANQMFTTGSAFPPGSYTAEKIAENVRRFKEAIGPPPPDEFFDDRGQLIGWLDRQSFNPLFVPAVVFVYARHLEQFRAEAEKAGKKVTARLALPGEAAGRMWLFLFGRADQLLRTTMFVPEGP